MPFKLSRALSASSCTSIIDEIDMWEIVGQEYTFKSTLPLSWLPARSLTSQVKPARLTIIVIKHVGVRSQSLHGGPYFIRYLHNTELCLILMVSTLKRVDSTNTRYFDIAGTTCVVRFNRKSIHQSLGGSFST